MSQYPRIVLTDVYVQWGEANSLPLFTRHGTLVDIPPGSRLETAYGGTGNLSGVVPAAQRGDGTCLSRAAQAN